MQYCTQNTKITEHFEAMCLIIGTFALLELLPLVIGLGNIRPETHLSASGYDAIIFVSNTNFTTTDEFADITHAIEDYKMFNPAAFKDLSVIPFLQNPSKRIIHAPTGILNRDYDDSRRIYEAAFAGARKAFELKFRSPLLVLGPLQNAPSEAVWMKKSYPHMNAIMGALDALYMPLEVREIKPPKPPKFETLGVFGVSKDDILLAEAMEQGRIIARDICGSDQERMTALKIVDYLHEELDEIAAKSGVGFSLISESVDPIKYPFASAVDRAASTIPRHAGRIVRIEYEGLGDVQDTLIFAGKGITFDSGGASIKLGSNMVGMHRDKCGAASVAGLFRTLLMLKPAHLKVIGLLGFIRNSIGANAVLPDEIITTLAGRRVRMVNTDAEGRMVLTDLLFYGKEAALTETNPHIFSVATLTGHSKLTYQAYTAVMDNGPAARKSTALLLQRAGDHISDMFEISTIRREDYDVVESESEYEDLMQSFHKNPSEYARGHQFPVAFMIRASGLDGHGTNSEMPLPYTHLDIYPASGKLPNHPFGASLMAFTVRYIFPRLRMNASSTV